MAQVIIHRALVHRQARAVYLVDLRLAASANASHNLQLEGQGEAVY
eukprot:CAMPEP_0181457576 /NCGR_PEP_ID=MMETSP1110-20121109/31857_1 /TAXON_ID=174948 /ORGANISM="Symbiodinium sp., Strain CCMP421" /LENGTH=45 /DNA_ID= /DNA_START= /DNA_END= /DNA_ORIENTATION=